MSLCITCSEAQPRSVLSNPTTTVLAVITAMTFSASGAAPTPLYAQYQESFGLTPFAITVIFAAYVLSLLTALLTVPIPTALPVQASSGPATRTIFRSSRPDSR